MPDLAVIDCGKQPVAGASVIENEGAVGKIDGTRQIGQAFGISTHDDWGWDVMPAAGDALAHAGQRSECDGKQERRENGTHCDWLHRYPGVTVSSLII